MNVCASMFLPINARTKLYADIALSHVSENNVTVNFYGRWVIFAGVYQNSPLVFMYVVCELTLVDKIKVQKWFNVLAMYQVRNGKYNPQGLK